MGVLEIRRPSQPDVLTIPTPPLQAVALFINFFLPALALISVALRFHARILLRQVALDDWLLLGALSFALAMVVPFYFFDVPKFDPSPGLWWFYLGQIFYNPVLALVKSSMLVFLLRLGGHRRRVRNCIYGLLTFNGLQAIAIFLVAVFQCAPISANWDPVARATATCVQPYFHIIVPSITVTTDILVLAIPFWIFLGLKLPVAARVAIIGVFLTGLAVTIIGAVRIASVYKLFYGKHSPNEDPYYNIGITLNVLEINLAIVSGAVPALRPLFRQWFPKLFGGSSKKYNNDDAYKYQSNSKYGKGTADSGLGHGHGGITLKNMSGRGDRSQHTEIRSVSPSGSEEEIMTSNGIMRTTDVQVQYGSVMPLGQSASRSSIDFKMHEATAPRGL